MVMVVVVVVWRELLYFPSFFLLYLQGKLKVHEEHTSASLNPKY